MAFKETGKLKSVNPLLKSHDISGTEFKLKFARIQKSDGTFKTTTSIVRGKKEYHGNNTGLLHKAVNLQYKAVGDVPSLQKRIDSIHTTSTLGKVGTQALKAAYVTSKFGTSTTIKTGLAAETATIKLGQFTKNAAWRKFKQNYVSDGRDDFNRGLLSAGGLTRDAVKGLKNHHKMKQQHKFEKAKFVMKKNEYKLFTKDSLNSKLIKNKEDKKEIKHKFKASQKSYAAYKKDVKSGKVNNSALGMRKALYKRRKEQFKVKNKISSSEKKQIVSDKKFAKKDLKTQKSISNLSKPGLLVLQPAEYGSKKLVASSWQKAISADERNDFMTAISKAQGVSSSIYQSRTQRLNRKQVKRDKLQKKNAKSKNSLKKQQAKLGKKKSLLTKSKSKKRTEKIAEKGVAKTAHVIALALKSPVVSIVAPYGAAIVIVLCVILLILSMLNGVIEAIFGNSSWVMGTYTAQDKYLSQAEEYYTKLAYEMNQKVLKCGTDDWKDGLDDFGVDTDDMDDDPDVFYWGRSSKFFYDPKYDFDCYKLWSFLSAYYYDFSTDDGEIEYWEYDGDTEDVIEELFKGEYKFEFFYDNTSRWEQQDVYQFEGGIDGRYWTVDNTNVYGSKLLLKTCPAAISDFKDDEGYIHFNSSLEILNPNDENKRTGWFIQDQRYFVTSPSGQQSYPFYSLKNDTTFGRYYSGEWHDREYFGFSSTDQVYHVVSSGDTKRWNSSLEDYTGLISFYQRYVWKTDCRLYYNVKTKKSFDEVIKDILIRQSNGYERYEYYLNFAGLSDDENAKDMHGNHQSFNCPVGGSILDCVDNGKIYNGFGYDMQNWNVKHCSLAEEDDSHQAIDIIYPELSRVYAPMDGYIKEINLDESYVIIRKNSFNYWYDGDGCGKTRDTEITLYGVSVASNLSEDDEVHKGDIIGVSLPEAKCEDVDNSGIGQYYLHIKIEIDTDGFGWDFIDPRLVFY